MDSNQNMDDVGIGSLEPTSTSGIEPPEVEPLKVFISGKITGLDDWGFPAFDAMEERLRSLGFDPINPSRNGRDCLTAPWDSFMRMAIRQMMSADRIIMLAGWEDSRGARIEKQLADAIGIPEIKESYLLALECTKRMEQF